MARARMNDVVTYVAESPGVCMRAATMHVLGQLDRPERATAYRQASAVVERVVRDRLVRQVGDRLYPWDFVKKRFADAIEAAAYAAPDERRRGLLVTLAIAAWREAGDENWATVLEGIEERSRIIRGG